MGSFSAQDSQSSRHSYQAMKMSPPIKDFGHSTRRDYQTKQQHRPIPLGCDVDDSDRSPDHKRRRLQHEHRHGSLQSGSSSAMTSGLQSIRRDPPPLSAPSFRQTKASGLQLLTEGVSRAQLSPLDTPYTDPHSVGTRRFDEALRLPPLQSSLPRVPPASDPKSMQRLELRRESREIQARSVEAMVMSISVSEKIKILARIAPPIAAPRPSNAVQDVRGAVIAVEGIDMSLTDEVGTFLNTYLDSDSTCYVKTWSALTPCAKSTMASPNTADVRIGDVFGQGDRATPSIMGQTRTDMPVTAEPFVEYLTNIARWHKKSADIIKFITSSPPPDPSKSKKSIVLPVALFPRGFSMTVSDRFAIKTPINDSYAPTDHWQWMATLWRGVVGPDFTVFVKRVCREELEARGAVEMRTDWRGCVVRIAGGEGLSEGTGRRLGFEVLEFVRGLNDVATGKR